MDTYTLELLSRGQLDALDTGAVPDDLAARAEPGGLPPPVVIARSREQLDAGGDVRWCGTYLIIRQADDRIVGGCRFKGPPRDGQVEISYGIASGGRRRGAGRAAVDRLCAIAFAAGADRVVAEIEPGNTPSLKTIAASGFRFAGTRTASDGVEVERWIVERGTHRETDR